MLITADVIMGREFYATVGVLVIAEGDAVIV